MLRWNVLSFINNNYFNGVPVASIRLFLHFSGTYGLSFLWSQISADIHRNIESKSEQINISYNLGHVWCLRTYTTIFMANFCQITTFKNCLWYNDNKDLSASSGIFFPCTLTPQMGLVCFQSLNCTLKYFCLLLVQNQCSNSWIDKGHIRMIIF